MSLSRRIQSIPGQFSMQEFEEDSDRMHDRGFQDVLREFETGRRWEPPGTRLGHGIIMGSPSLTPEQPLQEMVIQIHGLDR